MSKLTGLQRFIYERAEQYEGVENHCKIYVCAAKKFEIQFHWHSGRMTFRQITIIRMTFTRLTIIIKTNIRIPFMQHDIYLNDIQQKEGVILL
jgi:hypothetical protein